MPRGKAPHEASMEGDIQWIGKLVGGLTIDGKTSMNASSHRKQRDYPTLTLAAPNLLRRGCESSLWSIRQAFSSIEKQYPTSVRAESSVRADPANDSSLSLSRLALMLWLRNDPLSPLWRRDRGPLLAENAPFATLNGPPPISESLNSANSGLRSMKRLSRLARSSLIASKICRASRSLPPSSARLSGLFRFSVETSSSSYPSISRFTSSSSSASKDVSDDMSVTATD
ncbi:hypothetical protein HD553DRAFT_332913 [Filobasidium floriforme]|uniref:uncharacterized protein n=1 Tax=Filobasidium floriforme TaxID=5210 RepID=UPI001E8CA313|nr:uncharacterized protein HD553DRAFT_332913 [Filobasidium floriforme]KAH8090340.1 hypothetical protein HD553DRAFT_332913 [Filobasidium floriforme]